MKKIQYIYTIIVVLLFATGCEHHHLYYATSNTATVKINIDWSKTSLDRSANEIDKVSVMAYDSKTGKASTQLNYYTDNMDTIYVELPEGCHNLVIYNNVPSDFNDIGSGRAIQFSGDSNISTYLASGVERVAILTKNLPFDYTNRRVIKEPKALAACVLRNVEITRDEIDIFYDKPDFYQKYWVEEHNVTPRNKTLTFYLHVNIYNTKSGAGKPPISFAHTANGYYLGLEQTQHLDTRQEFNITLNKWLDANKSDGYFVGKWLTFADFMEDDYSYELFTSFILNDETTKEFTKTLKRSDIHKDEVHPDTYHIYWDIRLPEGIAGGDGGAFKPEAGEWDDVIVDL